MQRIKLVFAVGIALACVGAGASAPDTTRSHVPARVDPTSESVSVAATSGAGHADTSDARPKWPAKIGWGFLDILRLIASALAGAWINHKLAEGRDRKKVDDEVKRREDERKRVAAEKDYKVRHSLAIEVGPFLEQWESVLRDRDRGLESGGVLQNLDRDAEGFRRFSDSLGDILSDIQRGIAMRWCMGVRRVAQSVYDIRSNPELPLPGEGQVTPAMQAVRTRMRATAIAQVDELLQAGEQLRHWINVYDAGNGGLGLLPDAPPPMPHSTPGAPNAPKGR